MDTRPELKESRLFKMKYYSIGFDFSNIEKIQKCSFVAADTETHLTMYGKNVSDDTVYEYYKECTQEFSKTTTNDFRKNIHVQAWALTISSGENFALFQCVEDFLTALAYLRVDTVVWYNAKFDFSILDYYFLTHEWTNADDIIKELKGTKKMPKNTYKSLNGDFGQRYQLQIWQEYKNASYNKKVHKTKMIDLCNVLGGGLKKNLKDFDIRDANNEPIRKLEMDYDDSDIYSLKDFNYMVNDVKGLYYLTIKFDSICKELSGYSFVNGDFITAGGLAKKSLLKFMFKRSDKTNKKAFKYYFPMTIERDQELRNNYLYKGGMCFVNEEYKNKIVHNIYKYDVNSMYPAQMYNMTLPFGNPVVYSIDKFNGVKEDKVYILKIKNLYGSLKKNMIPVYMDCLSNDYVPFIRQSDIRYIYLEELEMYEKYYDLDYDIVSVLEFQAVYCTGMQEFIDNFYKIKSTTDNKSLKQVVKLFLNSSYGKLSQRVQTDMIIHTLSEYDYVHTERKKLDKVSDSALLSIFLGARVTALGRVCLMDYILKICKNNPKKYFVYCDTDSVHALCKYDDTDDSELGKMKCEGVYANALYLAPKTYLMQSYDKKYEVHTKGVNTDIVAREVNKYENIEDVKANVFKAGVKFKCLNGLNCSGGKALFYVDKAILNDDLSDDEHLNITAQEFENLFK